MRKYLQLILLFIFSVHFCWAQDMRLMPPIDKVTSTIEATNQGQEKTRQNSIIENVPIKNSLSINNDSRVDCADWESTYDVLDTDFGGAPCDDGEGCPVYQFTDWEIWSSEAYTLANVAIGGTYTFNICDGIGAGSWIPDFTVIAPSGAIDATGAGDGDGCSITWTATESGSYFLVINEEGECGGESNEVDNGYPTVTCTESAAVVCTPSECEMGEMVDPTMVSICYDETTSVEVTSFTLPTGGDYRVSFFPAATNLDPGANTAVNPAGFSLTLNTPGLLEFDSDAGGVLSFNSYPPMKGEWEVTPFIFDASLGDNGEACAVADTFKIVVFLDSMDAACIEVIEECDPPTGLLVDNITSNSADFSWTANGEENSFDVELVDITASETPTGEPTESGVSNPHAFTGLASNNDYAAYVRGNCSEESESDLILTAMFDGPLSGGHPKGSEIYVINDIPDLSIYGYASANNGNGSNGVEYTFSGSATAGQYLYIAAGSTGFNDWFGFDADFIDASANINGDDAIELYKNGEVVDVFGDVNTDGTGQPWEHLDGWAYRNDGTGPDGSTFQISNWTFSGINALDGESSNATATTPIPNGTYEIDPERVASDWEGPFNFTTLAAVLPVANFTVSETTICLDEEVSFTDLSTEDPISWAWDFGDGAGTSTDQNPDYIYTASGTYSVTLTVTNADGSDDTTFVDLISVEDPPLGFGATASEIEIEDGESTELMMTGTFGGAYTWFDEGGNIISSSPNFTVSPTTTTTYTAECSNGVCIVSADVTITVTSGEEPCLDFESPTPDVTPGWQNFNTDFGGAPCDDGTGCPFNEVSNGIEVWASEAYEVFNFIAGGEYTFSMCNGPGAGSWVPEFTIVAPSGAVDAFGAGDGDGCSISWTASESGTYLIIINEAGFCGTGSANTTTDNGYPALTCNSGGLAACAPVEPAPANDTCGGAIAISCGDDFGSVGATEATDADAPQGCSTSGAGLWYTFEGDDQAWTITATPIGWDNEIHIYSGDCDNLTCEDFADAGFDDDAETATVNAASGTTYYVYVGGWGTSVTEIDSFTLAVTCAEIPDAPVNDSCAGALELTIGDEGSCDGGAGFVSTSTAAANQTVITSCDGSLTDDADLWYTFEATSEAIQFNSLTGFPGIEIFDGSCGALGNTIGCLNNESGEIEGLTIGNTYFAVVWTDGTAETVEFCVSAVTLEECEAGTATSIDSITVCPDSTATFTTLGDTIVPAEGGYGILFEMGPDAGGALGGDFILIDINTPFTFDADLNGILSSNGYDEFTGTWYVSGAVYRDPLNAYNTICSQTSEYLTVTFLAAGEGDCAPPPPVPSNDTCGGAIALSCGDDFGVSALTATDGDAPQGCQSSGAGLWYTFEGDDQSWSITATPFGWDNEIHVYSGTCGDLTCETSADAGFTDDAETAVVSSVTGTTYYVYVGGWGPSVTEIDSFNITITCTPPDPEPGCGTVLYDNGGSQGDYANNSNDTVTICPDNPGDLVSLEFTFVDIEYSTGSAENGCWDWLSIYNGASTDADVISGALCGDDFGDPWIPEASLEVGDIFTSSDASGCLTVVFQSDGSFSQGGYAANITCAPAPVCEAPTALVADNITETSADLSWTSGGDESLWHLEIVDITDGGAFTGVPTISGLTDTFYLATGLTPSNDYAFYVITDCVADSSDWAGPENFTTLTPLPENDTCGGAIEVFCNDVISGTTADATNSDGPSFCGTSLTSAPGVWYSFTGNGQVATFSLCGSSFDTKIGLYSGSCDALICEDGNDDECSVQSEVTALTEVGTDYYVYVTGFSSNSGDFTLSVSCIELPENDACDGAIEVFCDDVISGSTATATNNDGPSFCGTSLTSAPGVWYTFAGTGDDLTASLCGSSFDTKIGIFSGSCGSLDCINGNDDECGVQSEVTVPTEVGTDYYIYVTAFSTNSGDFTLSLTCEIPSCDTVQIAETITDVVCGNDGAIDLDLTAGSGSFTFDWSNGATTEDISGLAAGDYTVNITDDLDGCPATATFTVGGNDPLSEPVPAAITTNGCDGTGTGATIDVTISGGTQPYTYLWSNGADTEDLVGLSEDDYTLTVTDDNGCIYTTQTFEITDEGSIFEVVDAVVVDVDCNGNATGSIDITLGGGTPPYVIRWSNDIHTEDIGGLVAGTYVFFATDQTGCEYLSGEIVVNEPDVISEALPGVVTNADCNGAATGSVDITVTGGTAPYTYLWTNGSTDEDPSDLAAGTHQATVTDANGCTFLTANYVIEAPTAIVQAGAVITDADCNGAATGSVDITVSGGTPGYTFDWSNGTTDEDLTDAPAGSYTVEITDANGCEVTVGPFTIEEPSAIMVTAATITDADCNGDATGSINISVAGGTPPYTYSWDNGALSQDLVDVAAGDYIGTITDANGCVLVSPVLTVGEPDALTIPVIVVTDVDCNGAATGVIDIAPAGGTGTYDFEWSNGETGTSISGVEAGTYSVTVTDENGCTVESGDIEIGEPDALAISSASSTVVLCNGAATGAIDIEVEGGTGIYSYEWSNAETSQDIAGLTAGTYSVVITDENGCELTDEFEVTEVPAIFEALPPAVTDVSCNGEADGTITATLQGGTLPYTITWSNGATGETVSDLASGIYSYSVVDLNGCTFDSEDIEVGEPDAITVSGTAMNIACFGESTGSISIVVEGGTGDYSYVWTNGETSGDISGLDAGDYTVTVTDANGCTATSETFTITAPASELSATVEVTDATGNGIADGSVTATATGGDGPYTFAWQGGFGFGPTVTGLEGGIYCVDVTDANNCVVTACGTVGYPTAIKDLLEISEITLYPNPTANYTNLNVRLSKAADMQLAVVDVLGKSYQEQTLSNVEEAEVQFDMTNFAGGTYFIRITVDKEVLSLPVIVQH